MSNKVLRELIEEQRWQLERAQTNSMSRGFMDMSANGTCMTPVASICDKRSKIESTLTVAEYRLLLDVRYTSRKEDIIAYVAVINKLIDAGCFDEPTNCFTELRPVNSYPVPNIYGQPSINPFTQQTPTDVDKIFGNGEDDWPKNPSYGTSNTDNVNDTSNDN